MDTAETDFPDGYVDTDGDGVGDNADVHPETNDAELPHIFQTIITQRHSELLMQQLALLSLQLVMV